MLREWCSRASHRKAQYRIQVRCVPLFYNYHLYCNSLCHLVSLVWRCARPTADGSSQNSPAPAAATPTTTYTDDWKEQTGPSPLVPGQSNWRKEAGAHTSRRACGGAVAPRCLPSPPPLPLAPPAGTASSSRMHSPRQKLSEGGEGTHGHERPERLAHTHRPRAATIWRNARNREGTTTTTCGRERRTLRLCGKDQLWPPASLLWLVQAAWARSPRPTGKSYWK